MPPGPRLWPATWDPETAAATVFKVVAEAHSNRHAGAFECARPTTS
jgi:hypothetical protein